MTLRKQASRAAEDFVKRHGLSHEHLLGLRFSINVLVAATIVWSTLRVIGDSNPIWAIASMVAASDPVPEEARRLFRSRLVNVLVGCAVGFSLVVLGGGRDWLVPLGLAITVLISSYLIRVKTMWRQAPITAAVVIAAGISRHSKLSGIEQGFHKVLEVLFGCFVGVLVSLLMSKVWLVRAK